LENFNKITLIHLFLPNQNQTYPPVGILSIASALRQKGFKVNVHHKSGTNENLTKIAEAAKGSLFAGLSIMTGASLNYSLKLSKLLKENDIPVVWGGIHPTFLPESTLQNSYVDYIIMGEGEVCVCNFAQLLSKKGDFSGLRGLGYKKGTKLLINERADLISNLDNYKIEWNDINIIEYLRAFNGKETFFPYLTSRGCPHRCGFCYNLNFNDRRWRPISSDIVIKDIMALKNRHNFSGIDFIDDNFFTDKKRAFSIVEDIQMPWIAEVRADYVNEEFIKECKERNCYKLFIGSESGSDDILKAINKDINTAQIENAVRICYKYGIQVCCSFMIMLPGETNINREETLNFINKLMDNYKDIEIDGPKIYTPYPGTPLFLLSKKLGWAEPKSTEEWSFYHRNMNPELLKFVNSSDIKKYNTLLGALAVKRDVILKKDETYPLDKIFKNLADWRLKNKITLFPLDLKIYMSLILLKDKIKLIKNNFRVNKLFK